MASTTNSSTSSAPSSPYIDRFNSSNLKHPFSFRGLQDFQLDLIKEADGNNWFGSSSSLNKELIWGRTWTENSPQITLLNRHLSCTALNADRSSGTCLFNRLKTVKLECKESLSGDKPLRALSETGVPLAECTLELTQSDKKGPQSYSATLHDVFVGDNTKFTPLIRTQLYNIVNFLRRGVLSFNEAALDLKNSNFGKLKSQITFDAMQSSELGGTFWGIFRANISTPNPKIFGLANPGKAITFVPGSYKGQSDCSLQEVGSTGKLRTTCVHKLSDNAGLKPTATVHLAHTEGETTTVVGSPTTADNWYNALRGKGLVTQGLTSSSIDLENNQKEVRIAHTFFGSSSSSSFNGPSKSTLLHSLLVPIGISMTAAGLFYAKSNYENTKKSDIRRVVGGVAGVAGAILGLGIASLPFNSL